MKAKPKRRIHQNIWGNINGYEGRKKVIEFGTDEREAQDWLDGKEVERDTNTTFKIRARQS